MKPTPAVPLWRLLPLLAAVLAAHLLLLQAAPGRVQLPRALPAHAFTTRTIAATEPEVIAAAPAAQPMQTPGPRPVKFRAAAAVPATGGTPRMTPVVQVLSPAAAAPAPQPLVPVAALPAPEPAPEPPSAASPLAIPGPVRLHYRVTAQSRGRGWSGEAQLVWRHDADAYEAMLEISAPWLPTRTQRSAGRITADGLAPLRFSDKVRSEEAAHFQRDKGKVSFSSNRPDAPLLPGAQDRLSVMLQLAAMIAGAPHKFPPATTISIQTAGTRDAEPWLFSIEQAEELQLPGGSVRTLKLTRGARREFDQKIELWLAPAMDYVPVRLRLTQPNGDSVDQQWASTDRD